MGIRTAVGSKDGEEFTGKLKDMQHMLCLHQLGVMYNLCVIPRKEAFIGETSRTTKERGKEYAPKFGNGQLHLLGYAAEHAPTGRSYGCNNKGTGVLN